MIFSPTDEAALHVPLAEAGKRNTLLGGPANEASELDFIAARGLLGAGRPEVDAEPVERLVPGQSLSESAGGNGLSVGVDRGGREKSGWHLCPFYPLLRRILPLITA